MLLRLYKEQTERRLVYSAYASSPTSSVRALEGQEADAGCGLCIL